MIVASSSPGYIKLLGQLWAIAASVVRSKWTPELVKARATDTEDVELALAALIVIVHESRARPVGPRGLYGIPTKEEAAAAAANGALGADNGVGQITPTIYEWLRTQPEGQGLPHHAMLMFPEYGVDAVKALLLALRRKYGTMELALYRYGGGSRFGDLEQYAAKKGSLLNAYRNAGTYLASHPS